MWPLRSSQYRRCSGGRNGATNSYLINAASVQIGVIEVLAWYGEPLPARPASGNTDPFYGQELIYYVGDSSAAERSALILLNCHCGLLVRGASNFELLLVIAASDIGMAQQTLLCCAARLTVSNLKRQR